MNEVAAKSFRDIVRKNLIQENLCRSTRRNIDTQRRTIKSQLTKDEKEMTSNLERLQMEQNSTSSFTDRSIYDQNDEDEDCAFENNVTNPYPVNFKQKTPVTLLPEIRRTHDEIHTEPVIWAGDPLAISSVRRPRKPLFRQKIEQHQLLSRSKSLKERPAIQPDADVKSRQCDSGINTPKSSCSRSGSLKGSVADRRGFLMRSGSFIDARLTTSSRSSGSRSSITSLD